MNILDRFEQGWYRGLDIPDGWMQHVLALDETLAKIDPNYTLLQVKEKFGGLRYYTGSFDGPTSTLDMLIRLAERRCATTCVKCGHVGSQVVMKGWATVLCSPCLDGKDE